MSAQDSIGLAGEQGLEPQQAVLETAVLPLYDTPMKSSIT